MLDSLHLSWVFYFIKKINIYDINIIVKFDIKETNVDKLTENKFKLN